MPKKAKKATKKKTAKRAVKRGTKRTAKRAAKRPAKRAAKLPEGFRLLHGLRHHYASMLVSSGVDLYVVSKLLGHSDPTLTAKRYAHLRPCRARVAREELHEDRLACSRGSLNPRIQRTSKERKQSKRK